MGLYCLCCGLGAVAAPLKSMTVGSVVLEPCLAVLAWCGSLQRPLDPSGATPGTIDIAFEFFPATDRRSPPLGTIVAAEGGPGYSTTGSRFYYTGLFAPLMPHRNLLLMDNRGTGRSQPIDCKTVQLQYPFAAPAVARCGAQLGEAAYYYGTGYAADDLAAILDALQIAQVDLYGDSYGTYFSQTFAGRHPDRLRSLVLDGAYQVLHLSPWYPANAIAMRSAWDAVCTRSATCRDLPGSSMERIAALLDALRTAPVSGTAPDGNGNPVGTTADPGSLANLSFFSGFGKSAYRELDAAARAYLMQSDAAPLLRLIAESQTDYGSLAVYRRTRELSSGLFLAVSCADYPQIYDLSAPVALRRMQRDAAFRRQDQTAAGLYAPFTRDEFLEAPIDYSLLNLCLSWPAPPAGVVQGRPIPAGKQTTEAPVLVLSGDLDTITAPLSGQAAAAQFAHGRQVVVANSFHVTALGDMDDCASELVRRFVETLSPGDTRCASQIKEVRTVPAFVRSAVEADAAQAQAGNAADDAQLRLANAALQSAGDALARWWVNYDGDGIGLRGGSFSYLADGDTYRFTLDEYRWAEDLAVTGTVAWNTQSGDIGVDLELQGATSGALHAEWNDLQPEAQASLQGTLDGQALAASAPAP
jgi:pimeloyl-ACP methyl ester carboxylesterase